MSDEYDPPVDTRPTEIFGSIEVWSRTLWNWMEIMDAGPLIRRDGNAFGVLFGIQNETGISPVAAERGLPQDVSPAVRRWASTEGTFGHTFLTWDDTHTIDWDAEGVDPHIHCFRRSEIASGEWIKMGTYQPEPPHHLRPGTTWMEDETLCRVRSITRREAIGRDFELVFALMEKLAERFGDEHVRLTVWFQNVRDSPRL